MAGDAPEIEVISAATAFVYIFNLVVGLGALTLPHAFLKSGVLLSSGFLIVLAFLSYISVTFVIESLSIANYLCRDSRHGDEEKAFHIRLRKPSAYVHPAPRKENEEEQNEVMTVLDNAPISKSDAADIKFRGHAKDVTQSCCYHETGVECPFELRQQFELSDLSLVFLESRWRHALQAVTVLYLFGDLVIYACAVPTSLASFSGEISIRQYVFYEDEISDGAYYMWLLCFGIVVVPLSSFDFKKTRMLQLVTCTYRNFSILLMVSIAVYYFMFPSRDGVETAKARMEANKALPVAEWKHLPSLFGVATYSFMCHHSIPSIVTPIRLRDRRRIQKIFYFAFALILWCYLVLCVTAALAFGHDQHKVCYAKPGPTCEVQDIYILNFESSSYRVVADFLVLLPVFMCSTSFPLIAITLRKNLAPALRRLIPSTSRFDFLFVSIPPIALAFVFQDVETAVAFTGGYAGLGIEFLFPTILVLHARSKLRSVGAPVEVNPYSSPFQSRIWSSVVLFWCGSSLLFITLHMTGLDETLYWYAEAIEGSSALSFLDFLHQVLD